MNNKEKKYFNMLFISTICLIVFFIISMVFAIKDIFNSQNINAYIFELLYAAFHLIVLGFAVILIIQSLKQGSFVIKGLMTEVNGKVANKKGQVIALVIASLSFIVFCYFSLVWMGVNLYCFNFPLILILLIVNVSVLCLVYGLFFFFYPIVIGAKRD